MLAGNGVVRTGAAAAVIRAFAFATGIGVAETFMGKGALDYEDPGALGTVGLGRATTRWRSSRSPTWSSPSATTSSSTRRRTGTRSGTRRSSASTHVAPEIDEHFMTEVDLVGDLSYIVTWLAEELSDLRVETRTRGSTRSCSGGSRRPRRRLLPDAAAARPVGDPQALGRRDMLDLGRGLHKLWIARMFPAHEPETVFIANGLAGMGIAADRDRRQARAAGLRRDGLRRRRLPDERPGARDRRAAAHDRQHHLGAASTARSSGSRTSASAATSASNSPTPTSCASPTASACRPGAARPSRTSAATCGRR